MNGAEAVIRCLEEEQVKVVFGYPGGAVLSLYQALKASPSSSMSSPVPSRERLTWPPVMPGCLAGRRFVWRLPGRRHQFSDSFGYRLYGFYPPGSHYRPGC